MDNEAYVPMGEEAFVPEEQPTQSPAKKIIILAAVLIVVVIAAIAALKALSVKTVAEKFLEAGVTEDFLAMDKYTVFSLKELMIADYGCDDEEEFCEKMSDWYDEDFTSWEDYCEYWKQEIEEEYEEDYGDYEITVEATRVKDISMKKLESECHHSIEEYEEELDFDLDDYSKAKCVTVRCKIKGEDDRENDTYDVYLLKDGLFWKVLDIPDL